MRLYLNFGFREKTHRCCGTETRSECPQDKGTGVPHGIKKAGAATELLDPHAGPSKVISLFLTCAKEKPALFLISREQCLALIEGLGRNLSGMVHAHQRGSMPSLWRAKRSLGPLTLREGHGLGAEPACAPIETCERSKPAVDRPKQAVSVLQITHRKP
jgi:hypothetical protein